MTDMMKKLIPIFFFLFLSLPFLPGQGWDLDLARGAKKIEIPFEYENDFIIVKILFNGLFPLNFIFDTGAEHTILTRREITDLLQMDYQKRFTIIGADLSTELYAYLVQGVQLNFGNFIATNRSILVLEEDYFRFQEFSGLDVQGILGADMFRRFVVQIDYQRKVISLYDPTNFRPPLKRFQEVPIEINRHKPYVFSRTIFPDDADIPTKLLLDTGASLALLLYTNTHEGLHLPPKVLKSNIGMGLGGFLEGYLGRIDRFKMGDFQFSGVITNFQQIDTSLELSSMNDRNGILGNQILSRFVIIIDYIREKMYLQPDRSYDEAFRYDRSGLVLAASGIRLNEFTVFQVIPDTPAAEAGIQVGDVIKTINRIPASFFTLGDVTRKLQGRIGKRIRLKIDRDGERVKVQFRLREII